MATGLKSYVLDNNLKCALLLAGFPFLLVLVAYAIQLVLMDLGVLPSSGDTVEDLALALRMLWAGAPLAFLVASLWYLVAYNLQGVIIAAATGAKGVTREDEPRLYNLVENLCISRGLPTPALKVVESEALNAYASGLNARQYAITVTRGLLSRLDDEELEAVLGHEVTHILNRDTRLMVICAVFAGVITLTAEVVFRLMRSTDLRGRRGGGRKGGGFVIVVAVALLAVGYALAPMIRLALSRKRELLADAGSVALTKNPDAMIRALQKIAAGPELAAPDQIKPLFFHVAARGMGSLMLTHPPIEERIEALVKYAGGRVEAVEDEAGGLTAPWPPEAASRRA